MINLSTVNEILKQTQGLAQAQAQFNAGQTQQTAQSGQAGQPSASTSAAGELFAQLGALLNQASNQPAGASTDPDLADLQRHAALLNAKVTALIAKADALENELNLSPQPDTVDVGELLAQFKEIMAELTKEIDALQKKVAEREKANKMKLEQKPTAMKPGEEVGDLSFNQTLTLQ